MATKTAKDSPLVAEALMPSMTSNDLDKSTRFYEGLGFVVDERWEEDGKLLGVMLAAGETRLGLSQDDGKAGTNRVKGVGMRIWINTKQDVDELARTAKTAGVQVEGPEDFPWGGRGFSATDPDGFKVTIARDAEN